MAYNPSQSHTTRHSILPSSQAHHQSTSNPQSSVLQSRISAKRAELANLKQLRDLSGQMATSMTALENKLSTLRDGTEAVSCILANWENVLGAIGMASKGMGALGSADVNGEGLGKREGEEKGKLPVTLVRIPVKGEEEGGG